MPRRWTRGWISRRWRATSSSVGSRTPNRRRRESAASGERKRSWKKANADPVVGPGVRIASERVDRRTLTMRSRLRHVLRPSWSSRCLHGESISTVGNMEGFDAEKDEDDGYKKPAG